MTGWSRARQQWSNSVVSRIAGVVTGVTRCDRGVKAHADSRAMFHVVTPQMATTSRAIRTIEPGG